ncbi:MAG TPA: HEPN domain-containing protein [Thermoanaerobacterales bacterium]|nr:HEPN domain-containing protein [Thermoanaerobacterales bacterium]
MRKSGIEEGKRWLEQAKEDLKWAQRLAEEGGYHIACFLSQQVAEKAIKAFLYSKGETIVIGHSVNLLSQKASQYNERIGEKCERWSILDGYYIPTRYPNGLPDSIPAKIYNKEIAVKAVELAEDAVNTVVELIEHDDAGLN